MRGGVSEPSRVLEETEPFGQAFGQRVSEV
jgi:hypothetical protein